MIDRFTEEGITYFLDGAHTLESATVNMLLRVTQQSVVEPARDIHNYETKIVVGILVQW